LLVHVAVHRLECQQQQHLQPDHGEPGGSRAEAGRELLPATLFRQEAPCRDQRPEQQAERRHHDSEIDTGHGTEKPAIALVELAAPQRDVEIVCHGREVAVDGRGCAGPELRVQVGHALRRDAKGDVIFAHVAGLEMARVQARQQFVRARGQRAGLLCREEVDRLTRNRDDLREHRAQALVDGAQELRQIRAHVIFRRPQLEGEETVWGELARHLAEEFHRVEAVQLGVLRLRQIDDYNVESGRRGFQKQPPIGNVHAHPRVCLQGQPLARKIFPGEVQNDGVEFHVIHPLERGLAQGLLDAPVEAAANEQETAGRRMLQQRVVNGLFGGRRIGHVEQDDAVFVNGPASFRADHGQASVDRVARGDEVLAAPEALLGEGFQALRPAARPGQDGHAEQSARGGVAQPTDRDGEAACRQEIEHGQPAGDFERVPIADEQQSGQHAAARRPHRFPQVNRTGSLTGGRAGRGGVNPAARREQGSRKNAERAQGGERGEQHRTRPQNLARHRLEDAFGGTHGQDRARQNGRDQHLDAGHQAARLPCARGQVAGQAAAGGRPEEPACEHQPEGALVAIEHHHQLPEEHDLGNGGGEANQNENCANSASGLHTSRIRRKLVVKSKVP